MSFFCDDIDAALGGYHTSAYTGLGLRGDAVPSSGADGPAALYRCITLPADASNEVFAQVTRIPTHGSLVFYEDSSFVYSGTTDYLEFRLWVDEIASTVDVGYGPGIVHVNLTYSTTPRRVVGGDVDLRRRIVSERRRQEIEQTNVLIEAFTALLLADAVEA